MIINVFYEKTDCRDDAFVSCFPIRMFFWIFLSTTVSGFIRKKQMTNNCFWGCKKTFVFLQPHFFIGYIYIVRNRTLSGLLLVLFPLITRNRIRFILNPFDVYSTVTLL